MDNYVIWRPERNGHAPPFWEDGMEASYRSHRATWTTANPKWDKGGIYLVPAEAVNGPAADDARDNAHFDVVHLRPGEKVFDPAAWLAEGRANADKLPAGVVLPESKDWADTLAAEILEMYVYVSTRVVNAEVADLIRTHCQPREVYNASDSLQVANKVFDFLGGVDGAGEIRAELMAAIAKATKP